MHSFICLIISAALWGTPNADALRAELAPFRHATEISEAEVTGAGVSEDGVPAKMSFEDVIDVLRNSSAPIKNYLEQCDRIAWQELPFAAPLALPQTPLQVHIGEGQTNYLFGALRYYLAQRLVQARLFDEAKKVLEDLTAENSIDPAGVLITKAVVFHHFSEKESGLAALKEFQAIAGRENVSRRAAELAKLLQFDWDKREREEESQKISRQMNDVRRRLGQGRTDDGTQEAEEGVLKSLEQLIERLEQQAMGQGQPMYGESQQSNNPAEESRRMALKGAGNVDRRDFAQGHDWGNLPPKEREEALLKIEKEFPAYYRDIIEQYFREMAK